MNKTQIKRMIIQHKTYIRKDFFFKQITNIAKTVQCTARKSTSPREILTGLSLPEFV